MIYDFAKIFEGPKAEIAVLSTYDFDPLYFENRLLRKNTLNEARRILIFMDHHCYQQLGQGEIVPRFLNQRYLLVPVRTKSGVFHPKLHLFVGRNNARVVCGSNNLTQAGSIHNLELFSVLNVDVTNSTPSSSLAKEALIFFRECLHLCEGTAGGIAKMWIKDLWDDYRWLDTADVPLELANGVELLHTFSDSPLKWMSKVTETRMPNKFIVISPFYDKDLRLLRVIQQTWPGVSIRIYAQQQSSNLPGEVLAKFDSVELLHLEIPNNRRLHAKLIAVDFEDEIAILSGSCNFTTAAFDGRNVEAALSMRKLPGFIDALFPDDVTPVPVSPKDFIASDREEPIPPDKEENSLCIWGAALNESGRLTFEYEVRIKGALQDLTVVLKSPVEKEARRAVRVPEDPTRFSGIQLSDGEQAELPASALFCRLEGRIDGQPVHSAASWVIHKHRLTYQSSTSNRSIDRERVIRDTGQGLTAYLDQLAKREGSKAVIEFLEHLNIRFQDGSKSKRGFGLRAPFPTDPTISQKAPVWSPELTESFEKAVFGFVGRHHKNVLHRHARGGNLNGLENYIDVSSACNKLLLIHFERGTLKPLRVMEWFLIGLYRLTLGGTFLTADKIEGYMGNVLKAQSGHLSHARKVMESYAIPEQAAFLLVAAQRIHMIHVLENNNPENCLQIQANYTQQFFEAIGLYPDESQYKTMLQIHGIDREEEKDYWWDLFDMQGFGRHAQQ